MNPLIQCKTTILSLLVACVAACFGVLPKAQAVVPPPDGGYPNFTTAEGQNALKNLSTGQANTAVGWLSLFSATTGSFNTATGAGALLFNTADNNTAFGAAALLFNTTGDDNTATGVAALSSNTVGRENTANGASALSTNTTGDFNTANGAQALKYNITGESNTANGAFALFHNTTGYNNTATGAGALQSNITGSRNVALGFVAGSNLTTGADNIYIGAGMQGIAGESNTCYIASIFGQTSASGAAVYVNSNHKLGTLTSSCRFKDDIKPMERVSEALFALKPVTFHYKKEIDPAGTEQFGLVAEQVEKVNPDLVVRDKEGKPYSVRYDQVNAMLLNEFLKEHRKNEQQEATIAYQQKQIKALTAGLQKVSAQLEVIRPAPQTALNNNNR